MLSKTVLVMLYDRLYQAYGPQGWWPAETPFEVMVGAVLTQNTAWTNVEKAITNLKQAKILELNVIVELSAEDLARFIRPAGYFNVKSLRLQHLCRWLLQHGGIDRLGSWATAELRHSLLAVHGIGPETADAILLYAFNRPVFVIDAYTRRLLHRLGLVAGTEGYEVLREYFEASLDPDPAMYNEYHAMIVRHAKEKCSGSRECRHCRVVQSVKVTSRK